MSRVRGIVSIMVAALMGVTACSAGGSRPADTTPPASAYSASAAPASTPSSPAAMPTPSAASAAPFRQAQGAASFGGVDGGYISFDNDMPNRTTLRGAAWTAPEVFTLSNGDSDLTVVADAVSGLPLTELIAEIKSAAPGALVLPSISDWGVHGERFWSKQLSTDLGLADVLALLVQTARQVKAAGGDGLSIDIEGPLDEPQAAWAETLRQHFTQLMNQLHQQLVTMDLKLTIAVLPKTSDELDTGYNAPYTFDYHALGQVADQVLVMSYDEHETGSNAGPIASLGWVKQVLAYAKSEIPAAKLSMGIAYYGYGWATKPAGAKHVMLYGGTTGRPLRLSPDGERVFTYTAMVEGERVTYQAYVSGLEAVKSHTALARKLGVGSFVYAFPGADHKTGAMPSD